MPGNSGFWLAEFNVSRARAPMDSPTMEGFVRQLAAVNELADRAPGFVWRLQTDAGNAIGFQAYDDPRIIVNLSVWESIESLREFTYGGHHLQVMRSRREWFEAIDGPSYVLWWARRGTLPTLDVGKRRLERLAARGPTPFAFHFKNPYSPP